MRIYQDHSEAPLVEDQKRCPGRYLIDSHIGSILMLPDETLLVEGRNGFVLRVRLSDGRTPYSTPTFWTIDTVEVLKAKLKLMERQAESVRECLKRKVKPLWTSDCPLYPISETGFEKAQRDLIRLMFRENARVLPLKESVQIGLSSQQPDRGGYQKTSKG